MALAIIRKSVPPHAVDFFVWIVLAIFLLGCSEPEPIRIGFVGGLTGRVADLGISGRDGVILAVEEINQQGGIRGRQVELQIRDDRQTPRDAALAVSALVKSDVTAIIGHMTSAMSLVGAPIADQARIPMISPTTSTNELSRKDDYFFRTYPASADAAATLADHAWSNRSYRTVSILQDMGNRAHTQGWMEHFKGRFERHGGRVIHLRPFVSGKEKDFAGMAADLAASGPDALFILANALDTAMVCQQLAKAGNRLPVLVSEWSATPEVITFGGGSVNGMEFLHTFDQDDLTPAFTAFLNTFRERFKYDPGFAATHSYDAVQIIRTALTEAREDESLKQAILRIQTFDGLQDRLRFNAFGDIQRTYHLMTIENGRFKRLTR